MRLLSALRGRGGSANAIDRDPQHIPISLGGLAPAHSTRARRPPALVSPVWWLSVVAAGLGVAGVVLATNPAQTAVYSDEIGLHVGGTTMAPVGGMASGGRREYEGDVSMVIVTVGSDEERAAAVTVLNGTSTSGVCTLVSEPDAGASEVCRFVTGESSWTAHDVFNASTRLWHRAYSDGKTAVYPVPKGKTVVPIPIPLSR